ncbi:MAG: hypothetical protein M0R46_08540 [Candidatus Muirbacterium halophilum]|nr:hypothetical protein [Candidatus Muirbacterium halophilum]MCK9475952.1 hypothetical protein [Candidatus Muirbacterium halophilum]
MIVLGICVGFEKSCSISENGELLYSVCEKDFSIESTDDYPFMSIDYCLKQRKITLSDVDSIVFAQKPYNDFLTLIKKHILEYPFKFKEFTQKLKQYLKINLNMQYIIEEYTDKEIKYYYAEKYWSLAYYYFSINKDFKKIAIYSSENKKYYIFSIANNNFAIINIVKNLEYSNINYDLAINTKELIGHEYSAGAALLYFYLEKYKIKNNILFPVIKTKESFKEIYFTNNSIHFEKINKIEIEKIIKQTIDNKEELGIFYDNNMSLKKQNNNYYYKNGIKNSLNTKRNLIDFIKILKEKNIKKAVINHYLIRL